MNDNRKEPAEEKALAEALLAIDSRIAGSLTEGREVAREVLRRDQRRVRILTWMTIGLFLLTVIGICGSVCWYNLKVVPGFGRYKRDIAALQQQLDKPAKPDLLDTTARIMVGSSYMLFMLQFVNLWGTVALFTVMLAAAVCTVLLIMATRRATLRQIQASLLALSEQFDTLQRSLQCRHSAGSGQATQGPDG